jgi:hypothetical protein
MDRALALFGASADAVGGAAQTRATTAKGIHFHLVTATRMSSFDTSDKTIYPSRVLGNCVLTRARFMPPLATAYE